MGRRRSHEEESPAGSTEQRRSSKRRKPYKGSPARLNTELLIAAALGDRGRCKSLIKAGADVHCSNAEVATPLHEASRAGHRHVVAFLLRRGALAAAQDLRGDSPAHLAARFHHLKVLTALLRAPHPVAPDLQNDRGETVQHLADVAMAQQTQQATLAQEHAHQRRRNFSRHCGDTDGVEGDWGERLMREMSPDMDDFMGAYYGSEWHADEYETAEEYAARIWTEMEFRRKNAAARESLLRGTRKGSLAEKAPRKQNAETPSQKEAPAPAHPIDTRTYRNAVAAGTAGTKLASYEARWEFFCTRNLQEAVTYSDVPWVVFNVPGALQIDDLRTVLFHGCSTPEERRRVLRRELIRWHPDKFEAKFGRRLAPQDRERIINAVTDMGRLLTQLRGFETDDTRQT